MNEPAYLVVWLIGLFGLIGLVMAAVVRLIRMDTLEHDRRFVWKRFERGAAEDETQRK